MMSTLHVFVFTVVRYYLSISGNFDHRFMFCNVISLIIIECLITGEDGQRSLIETCINSISDHVIAFELTKAHTLATNLGIGSGRNNFVSYKEVCMLWLSHKGVQCSLGQLVCALIKSGLARLTCGLRPICKL